MNLQNIERKKRANSLHFYLCKLKLVCQCMFIYVLKAWVIASYCTKMNKRKSRLVLQILKTKFSKLARLTVCGIMSISSWAQSARSLTSVATRRMTNTGSRSSASVCPFYIIYNWQILGSIKTNIIPNNFYVFQYKQYSFNATIKIEGCTMW